MGERGPEAILPLSRGADGKLGVAAGAAARPVNVIVNVATPDADSFRRSEAQVAAAIARAAARGRRAL
jgi:phage-related minor tail protein